MRFVKDETAQVMLIFALLLSVLILFTGLAIDAGLLYVTKAKLTSSVDGATLAGMKSLPSGQTTASNVATDIFDANYGANPPAPVVTFPKDAYGDQQVEVTATTNVNTLFMRILPGFATVPVSDTAVATRGKLIMSIVVDRSGSMQSDSGGAALQAAVPLFVGDFDNSTDEVGLISFASNATINYSINYNFSSPIDTAMSSMQFSGGTFGTGAGTGSILNNTEGPPLSLAQLQNDSVTVTAGQNIVKVVVYLTDGLMNTVQDNFHCGGKTNNTLTLLNYGGYDSGTTVAVLDPLTGDQWSNYGANGLPYDAKLDICYDANGNKVSTFPSQEFNDQESFTRANVTAEAQWRAIQTATALRTETPIPEYIYTIGLGTGVSPTTQAFLAQLANDPSYSTYISGQPAGLFFYIPSCTGSNQQACTNDLNTVFQTIAAKVLLRLTQ